MDKEIREVKNISEAMWHSAQSPGPVPRKAEFDPRFSLTERKDLTVKFAPLQKPNPNESLCESLKPFPGPGTYKEVEKAKSFVLRKPYDAKIGQEKK